MNLGWFLAGLLSSHQAKREIADGDAAISYSYHINPPSKEELEIIMRRRKEEINQYRQIKTRKIIYRLGFIALSIWVILHYV